MPEAESEHLLTSEAPLPTSLYGLGRGATGRVNLQ